MEITYSDFTALAISGLYRDVDWPLLALILEDVYRSAGPGAMAELVARTQGAAVAPYDNQPEALRAIICADTANPDDPSRWPELAAAADEETPYVGSYWTYVSQQCADWPVETQDAYTGPFDAATANPVLVIGTRFDPATPYVNAEELAGDLPGARLLTLEGYGHTSRTGSPSTRCRRPPAGKRQPPPGPPPSRPRRSAEIRGGPGASRWCGGTRCGAPGGAGAAVRRPSP